MRSSELLKNAAITVDVREAINWRAYMLFVNGGGEHGNDLGHWLQAEQEILFEQVIRSERCT